MRFERAHGGTLFLDELSELSPRAQADLLRALQEHQIERVGGQAVREVDVRIVAATHADLARRMEEGSFRRDLYFRLNAFTLTVTPLRERREDIPALAEHFLARCEHHYQRRTLGFSNQASAAMTQYTWPGNVHELKNAIERGVILTTDHKHITERALFGDYQVPTLQREKSQGLDDQGRLVESSDTSHEDASPAYPGAVRDRPDARGYREGDAGGGPGRKRGQYRRRPPPGHDPPRLRLSAEEVRAALRAGARSAPASLRPDLGLDRASPRPPWCCARRSCG